MIPKTIHYCWFGHGEMSPMMKKCIRSWKKYCPDYEIIEWNEDNFAIDSTVWTKEAYDAKKYAFVADYVRLKVLYEYGGVYLDTDQELIKPIDIFMRHQCFMGFMEKTSVNTGLLGAEKGHPIIGELLAYYIDRTFLVDGKPDLFPNTEWVTQILLKHGMIQNNEYQIINADTHIYPQTFFCPTSCVSPEDCKSNETVALHHWAMTWRKPSEIKTFKRVKWHQTRRYRALIWLRYFPNRIARRIFGDEVIEKMKKVIGK